ncbi:MAG: hypothetical protein R6U52_01515 [Kosmotogaceae bacterium]
MTWDKTQPTDTTKLRNLGVVIRPNWEAIESADDTFIPHALNFTDRDAAGLASDPTAITDAMIAYSKQDADGDPQLYAIDPSSVVTKLTGGSQSAAAKGHLLFPGGIKINWGKIISTANVPKEETFDSAFDTAVYSITLTPLADQGSSRTAVIDSDTPPATDKFYIRSTNAALIVYYIAIGK